MAIHIPDNEDYKGVEEKVKELSIKERRSITKMAVVLMEEAIAAREKNESPE